MCRQATPEHSPVGEQWAFTDKTDQSDWLWGLMSFGQASKNVVHAVLREQQNRCHEKKQARSVLLRVRIHYLSDRLNDR